MSNLAVVWSIDKFKELEAKLIGFWAEDVWDMRNCPTNIKPYADSLIYLKFFCPSIAVNKEIKYALWRKFTTREWSSHTSHHLCCLFNWFRDDFSPTIYSLTQKSKDEWEERFIFYLTNKKNKVTIYKTRQYLTRIRGNAQYSTNIPALSCLREIYRVVSDFYDARSEYEKDIWDLDKLGIKRSLTRCVRRLNFNAIDQIWLRQIVKKYLRYCLSIYSLSYCSAVMHTLNNFSAFLNGSYPSISASIIDRSVVIDYLAHLKSKNLSPKTKDDMLIILRIFLEICSREDWAPFPKERIIHNEDLPKKMKRLPRFIPDDVLNQLFQHLGELPIHYQRMIHILYHVGMRISELLNLHYDCLMQDKEGSWWIKFYQSKFKQEHTQPITAEIANIIQAQQREVTDKRGTSEKSAYPRQRRWLDECYRLKGDRVYNI